MHFISIKGNFKKSVKPLNTTVYRVILSIITNKKVGKQEIPISPP